MRLEALFANDDTCVGDPVEGEMKRTEANKIETKKRDFRRVLASCMVSPALYADYLYFKSITLRLYDLAVKLVTLTLILLSWQIYKGYQRGGVTRTDTHGSTSENYGHCWRFRD